MSLTLAPSTIALLALRRIRHTSWFETGGEGPALTIALQHLDLVMAELAGTERLWWLVSSEIEIAAPADQQDYDLSGILNPDAEDIIRAAWIDANRQRHPICLYRLIEWDDLDDRETKVAGRPEGIYVEHTPTSRMWLYPIPTEDGTITLTRQAMASNLASAEAVDHQAPTAWQRYFVLALAAEIGAGPIERLSEQEIRRLLTQAADAKAMLLARNRKENVRRPRFVKVET